MICTISKVNSDMPKMPNKSCVICAHTHWLLTCVRVHAMGFTKSNKVVKTYIVVLLMLCFYLHPCCARGGNKCPVNLKELLVSLAFLHYTYSISSCWRAYEYSTNETPYFISFLAKSFLSSGATGTSADMLVQARMFVIKVMEYVCYYSHLPRLCFFGVQCTKSCQF